MDLSKLYSKNYLKNKFYNLGVLANLIAEHQIVIFPKYSFVDYCDAMFVLLFKEKKEKYGRITDGIRSSVELKIKNQRPLKLMNIIENVEFHIDCLEDEIKKKEFKEILNNLKKYFTEDEKNKLVMALAYQKNYNRPDVIRDEQIFNAVRFREKQLVLLNKTGTEEVNIKERYTEYEINRLLEIASFHVGELDVDETKDDVNIYEVEKEIDNLTFKGFVTKHKEGNFSLNCKAELSIQIPLFVKFDDNNHIMFYEVNELAAKEYFKFPTLYSYISLEDYLNNNYMQKAFVKYKDKILKDFTVEFIEKDIFYLGKQVTGILSDFKDNHIGRTASYSYNVAVDGDVLYAKIHFEEKLTKEFLEKINKDIFYIRTKQHYIADKHHYEYKIYEVKKEDNYILSDIKRVEETKIFTEKDMLEYSDTEYLFVKAE